MKNRNEKVNTGQVETRERNYYRIQDREYDDSCERNVAAPRAYRLSRDQYREILIRADRRRLNSYIGHRSILLEHRTNNIQHISFSRDKADNSGLKIGLPSDLTIDLDQSNRLRKVGALHFLRGVCNSGEGEKWRSEARALINAEAAKGNRREQLIASFNRGYSGFEQTYHSCTPVADTVIHRYMEEGAKSPRYHCALRELNQAAGVSARCPLYPPKRTLHRLASGAAFT